MLQDTIVQTTTLAKVTTDNQILVASVEKSLPGFHIGPLIRLPFIAIGGLLLLR